MPAEPNPDPDPDPDPEIQPAPTPRWATRVVMLDQADRVLLLALRNPTSGATFWHAPGGGIEPDEDVRAAAAREIAEETGLRDLRLGPEIWHRRHVYTWRDIRHDQRERWFLARVAHFEPDRAGMTDEEQVDVLEARWWSLQELLRTTDELSPRELAARLRTLLTDGPPPAPIAIGA